MKNNLFMNLLLQVSIIIIILAIDVVVACSQADLNRNCANDQLFYV